MGTFRVDDQTTSIGQVFAQSPVELATNGLVVRAELKLKTSTGRAYPDFTRRWCASIQVRRFQTMPESR